MKRSINVHSFFSSITCLFFLLILPSILFAQKDYKWEDSLQPSADLPEAYAQEDAVVIYDYEERQTQLNNGLFLARNILKRRIKILTPRGLENFGKIVIPKKSDLEITILDTRTIKQNGTLVDHEAKNIKSLDLTDQQDIFDRDKYLLFSVPGLEVGDEFELVCVYEGQTIQRGNNIYLNSFLPVLSSNFVLNVDKRVIVLTNTYNGMPDPKMEEGLENYRFSWTMKNLPGLYDDKGIIPSLQLPYFIYELNLNRFYTDSAPPDIQNWRDLLLYVDQQSLQVIIRKSKKFKKIYAEILGDKGNGSQLEQLQKIHQFINKEIQLKRIPENEESRGIEFFLEERKADYLVLLKMYKILLDQLDMKYYLASCKNRYQGPIQLNFPSLTQITDYTFVIEDKAGNFHLAFPKSTSQQFELDEIPPFLEGTSIYLLDLKNSENFKEIKIPLSPFKQNKRLRKIKTQINLDSLTIHHAYKESFEGAASTHLRNFYVNKQDDHKLDQYFNRLWTERLASANIGKVQLTKVNDQFPFKFFLDYDIQLDNALTKIDQGIFKINIDQWFPHQLYKTSSNSRLLNYYPLFAGIDAFSYYLSFDQAIQLVNKENIDQKIETPFGIYEISIHQINEKTIALRSKYILKVHEIKNDKIQDLRRLNETALQSDGEGIIIQLLPK